jgi:hypothetical protein
MEKNGELGDLSKMMSQFGGGAGGFGKKKRK